MKPIKGYEGLYSITEEGDVWNHRTEKWMKPRIWRRYYKVGLTKDKVKKYYQIHRLVAEAYIPNPNFYKFVVFKDKNSDNIYVSNLKWASQKGIYEGRRSGGGNKNMPIHRKLTDDQVRSIRKSKHSQMALGAFYGVSNSCISLIQRNKTYKHVTGD